MFEACSGTHPLFVLFVLSVLIVLLFVLKLPASVAAFEVSEMLLLVKNFQM